MQNKTEHVTLAGTPGSPSTPPKSRFSDALERTHEPAWKLANFTTVAAATSSVIIAVQSPVKTVLASLSKTGNFMPSYTGGVWGMMNMLYKGTMASIGGQAARTVYVTNARNARPVEERTDKTVIAKIEEERPKAQRTISRPELVYVAAGAAGEVAFTQIPESLSTLKKVPGLLPDKFNWKTPHNAYQLMSGGFYPRYFSGMVNFASMCLLETEIAKRLPIEDTKTKHFAAGAMSGMTAAFFSYPFNVFKEYTLVRATVTNTGKLVNQSALSIAKGLQQAVAKAPKEAVKAFLGNAAKQLPIRMGVTGAVFAIVAGVNETLGDEPLKKVVPERFQPPAGTNPQSFFGGRTSRITSIEEVVDTPTTVKDKEPPSPK